MPPTCDGWLQVLEEFDAEYGEGYNCTQLDIDGTTYWSEHDCVQSDRVNLVRFSDYKYYCEETNRDETECRKACMGEFKNGKCKLKKAKKVKCRKIKDEETCLALKCTYSPSRGKCTGTPELAF